MFDGNTTQSISFEVIKTLHRRFEKFPEDSNNIRNAPFHEVFLAAFSEKLSNTICDIPYFISLSSWLHGLNTALGCSFFEKTSHSLSLGSKKKYTEKERILEVTSSQKELISQITTELKNGNRTPNLIEENELLKKASQSPNRSPAIGFTVDVFFERNDEIIAIELKSVRPNSGEMKGEKAKILEGKAALMLLYPEKKINYYIGFPFDPTSSNSIDSDKERFINSIVEGKKFFDKKEILLAGELWDFLSEDINTMEQILTIINQIATPDFQKKYIYLNEFNNKYLHPSDYKNALAEWFLLYELIILDKFENYKTPISPKLIRLFDQPIFNDGKYNIDRYSKLITMLS